MDNIFALNEKEKKTLSSLYALGNTTVSKLAKATLINRTTLYPILEKLLAKGLVSKTTVEDKILFAPISLPDLKAWVKRQRKKMEDSSGELLDWAEHVSDKKVDTMLSEVTYFEGFDGMESLYADTWRDNPDKEIMAITDYQSAYEKMEDFFRKSYFPQRVKHDVVVKDIIPDSKIARSEVPMASELKRDMRFIDIFENLDIELNIYNDKVSIAAFDEKKPSGVLIKNKRIAEAMKKIFNYMWQSAEKS